MAAETTTHPAVELAKAQSHLNHLIQLEQNLAQGDDTSSRTKGEAVIDNATLLYKRAIQAQDEIQFIRLQKDIITLVNDTVKSNESNDAEKGGAEAALAIATDQCTSLGILLIQYAFPNDNLIKTTQLYAKIKAWYDKLHMDTRQIGCNLFRAHLQKEAPEYPSNLKTSAVIADIFSSSQTKGEQQPWSLVVKCLIELQIIQDAIQIIHSQTTDKTKFLSPQWRLDIVDELCRPIAERLRYHFLGKQSSLFTASSPPTSGGLDAENNLSSMDRLPEWLFRYLREIMENHGAYSVVMIEGVQPLVDRVVDSLLARTQLLSNDFDDMNTPNANCNPSDVLMHLKQMYFSHSSIYFLREVSRMARHALRANSFLNHPDMVGSECRDRRIALRGIEQLFLFDDLLKRKIENGDDLVLGIDPMLYPVRMTDTFLTPREDLLLWWMKDEFDMAMVRLQKCATSTLSSYQHHQPLEGSHTNNTRQQLCPPITDLFAAILYSSRSKANAFSDVRSQQMYVARVIAPLSSEYLELMHGEAKFLRQRLVARDATKSCLGSDECLTGNVLEWVSIITGVHMAAHALLRYSGGDEEGHQNPLEDVIKSIFSFGEAMVEEFVSAFVEQIMMENMKLAVYTMRAPFLLSEHHLEHPERRGQRDKDISDTVSLSPDLNDSVHVLSIVLKACQTAVAKVESMESRKSEMMYFGSKSIENGLSHAVGCKFLDIGLDPMGMCPDIYLEGAKQFYHDVCAFKNLFLYTTSSEGPMERAVAASQLMSLDDSTLSALRDALCALISTESASGPIFISDFSADSRLLEEAECMLAAKGFGCLAVEEALSIINRRR